MYKVKLVIPIVLALSFLILNTSMSKGMNCASGLNRINKITTDQEPSKKMFTLYQNETTEFSDLTRIQFDLNSEAHVTLIVTDLHGKIIENLIDGCMEPGQYNVYFKSASKAQNEKLSYKIAVNGLIEMKRIISKK